MGECIFCKIASGEIKTDLVYQDEDVLAFYDIKPQAPTHIVIIPKKHIARVSDVHEADKHLVGKMFVAAKDIAKERSVEAAGYRLVVNCGKGAGQEVDHIHVHLLGGRKFSWPPG